MSLRGESRKHEGREKEKKIERECDRQPACVTKMYLFSGGSLNFHLSAQVPLAQRGSAIVRNTITAEREPHIGEGENVRNTSGEKRNEAKFRATSTSV